MITSKPLTEKAQTGADGERAAIDYLRARGYEICARNWRMGRYELDIVARKQWMLHFVEVKTRRVGSLTTPTEAMTPQKIASLQRAARAYLAWSHYDGELQFDLAAVTAYPDGHMEVDLIEDVMY